MNLLNPKVMNKAEEYYIKRFSEPADRHEKKFQKHDYWDMVDFAEQYAQQEYERGWEDARKIYRPEI